jgi:hypothetical protein
MVQKEIVVKYVLKTIQEIWIVEMSVMDVSKLRVTATCKDVLNIVLHVLNVTVPTQKEWNLNKLQQWYNKKRETKVIKLEELEIMMVQKEIVVKYVLKIILIIWIVKMSVMDVSKLRVTATC